MKMFDKPVLLEKETDILKEDFRKRIIEEILGSENTMRKHECFKRHEQYKDRSYFYVVDLLIKQFSKETVSEMQYALSNVSITRKIINKLAKVYNKGAIRKAEIEGQERTGAEEAEDVSPETKMIEELAKLLRVNQAMKKCNRYLKLQKNCLVFTKPMKSSLDEKWSIALQVLAPFLYDVIPDPMDPEKPLVVILSHYVPLQKKYYDVVNPAIRGQEAHQVRGNDGVNQAIADSPEDEMGPEKGQYIWWSPNFHFTTDEKGGLMSGEELGDGENPIKTLPFVNFADDQDGAFWALGGDDIAEGSIKLNALLTHLNHIAVTQGYGQLFMTGKGLPKGVQVGPNHAIQLEYNEGDPKPEIGYLTANPPIESVMKIIEAQFALLLATNNLSTSGFSTKLEGARQFASGIAMMLDKAESIEDTDEQAEAFVRGEPKVWELIGLWLGTLDAKKALSDDLRDYKLDPNTVVEISFPPSQPIQSESEHLDVLAKRKDLGLNTLVDLIMKDNPGMTKEDAQKKLEEIKADQAANMPPALAGQAGAPGAKDGPPQADPNADPAIASFATPPDGKPKAADSARTGAPVKVTDGSSTADGGVGES